MKSNQTSMIFKLLLVIAGLALFSVASYAAFSLDLVAKVAVTSFEALVKSIPGKVVLDTEKGGWAISGLDRKDRIILSNDFSRSNPDIALEFDAAPFVKAGLDVSKLPSGQYQFNKTTGKLTLPFEYGKDKFGVDAQKSVLNTFKQIVKTHRKIIGYHEVLDHYGIALGDGNMFEWAKDLSTNDKDMVFVLNPQPLINAGVNPDKVTEWVFGKVQIKDENGKPVTVDKFLKPFNIR